MAEISQAFVPGKIDAASAAMMLWVCAAALALGKIPSQPTSKPDYANFLPPIRPHYAPAIA